MILKKTILGLLFLVPVSAFSLDFAVSANVWNMVGLGHLAAEIGTEHLSVYVPLTYLDQNIIEVDYHRMTLSAQVRFYPFAEFSGPFVAAGPGAIYNFVSDESETALFLNVGWKFVFGKNKPSGFFIEPRFGYELDFYKDYYDAWANRTLENIGLAVGYNF